MRCPIRLAVLLPVALLIAPAQAQQDDEAGTFTWQEYGRSATCDLALHLDAMDDDARPHLVILAERADNEGPSVVDDLRYLAEQIGRTHGIDPAEATWVVRWGASAFPGAEGQKELFLQARFRRTKSGNLSSPSWRVLSREQAEDMTGRRI
jgi:hypothetical protein